jgi:hypothetical protein
VDEEIPIIFPVASVEMETAMLYPYFDTATVEPV